MGKRGCALSQCLLRSLIHCLVYSYENNLIFPINDRFSGKSTAPRDAAITLCLLESRRPRSTSTPVHSPDTPPRESIRRRRTALWRRRPGRLLLAWPLASPDRRAHLQPAEHRLEPLDVARCQKPRLLDPAVALHAAAERAELGVEALGGVVIEGGELADGGDAQLAQPRRDLGPRPLSWVTGPFAAASAAPATLAGRGATGAAVTVAGVAGAAGTLASTAAAFSARDRDRPTLARRSSSRLLCRSVTLLSCSR